MIDVSRIKALTFDVFGTVVSHRECLIQACRALGRDKRIEVDAERFVDAWRSRHDEKVNRERRGEGPWIKAEILHRQSLVELLPEFGIAGLSEAEIDDLNATWGRADPWPDSVPGLARIKRKFIIAAMSNGNVALMIRAAKHAGLPWDMILGSEIARHHKPHVDVYLKGAEMLGVEPGECLMVATHNYDLLAARDNGYHTAYVYRRAAKGRGPEDQEPAPGVDWVVENFLELADRLGC